MQRFVRSDSERMAETNNLIPTGRGHYEASVSLKAKHYAALTGTEHATACYELLRIEKMTMSTGYTPYGIKIHGDQRT